MGAMKASIAALFPALAAAFGGSAWAARLEG
jgi:hypothetical protein